MGRGDRKERREKEREGERADGGRECDLSCHRAWFAHWIVLCCKIVVLTWPPSIYCTVQPAHNERVTLNQEVRQGKPMMQLHTKSKEMASQLAAVSSK